MAVEKLVLEPHRWYGWQMLPGYSGDVPVPYFSPIRIHAVTPLRTGASIVRVSFWNAFYAQGVQDFSLDLRLLLREANYLVARIRYESGTPSDRSAVISRIGVDWLARFAPECLEGRSLQDVASAGVGSIDRYLDGVFGFDSDS